MKTKSKVIRVDADDYAHLKRLKSELSKKAGFKVADAKAFKIMLKKLKGVN